MATSFPQSGIRNPQSAIQRHPLRQNLEVTSELDGSWIRCTECGHPLCGSEADWTEAAARKLLEPTKVGPLMAPLTNGFRVEQLYCPGCGVLLNTDVVEIRAKPSAY